MKRLYICLLFVSHIVYTSQQGSPTELQFEVYNKEVNCVKGNRIQG